MRGARPGSFALVMATGIVSTALDQAGWALPSAALLTIAAACFAALAAASALRAAAFPADVRAGLTCPKQAFTCFALVAASDVLGARLAADGHGGAAAGLAALALAAWLALSGLVPGRMAIRRQPAALSDVSGNWYLWAVSTQSLAIAAMALRTVGLRAQPAALAAIAAWSAGVALYLLTSVLVAARLLRAGLRPADPTAPYWVAMGAASITVLAAVQILADGGSPTVSAAKPELTALAVGFWILAGCLIPPLIARSAARHLCWHQPLGYRADLWMIVFPAGMYTTASLQLGAVARLPLIHGTGMAAVWVAAAVWALTFASMIVSLAARVRAAASPAGPSS